MAKREISGTLRNLKFMQRAILKDVKKKNDDEEPNGNLASLTTARKKCVVITDWYPQPGALVGRMSFQSFNPSIEKLNEEVLNGERIDGSTSTSSCSSKEGKMSFSQNAWCLDQLECPKVQPSLESNSDMKRKQPEVGFELHYPNKFRRNGKGDSFKHKKGEKVYSEAIKTSNQNQLIKLTVISVNA